MAARVSHWRIEGGVAGSMLDAPLPAEALTVRELPVGAGEAARAGKRRPWSWVARCGDRVRE